MFRKLAHIILSLFLLTTTTGITLSKHYCGGKLVSTSLNHHVKSCCDMDGCCHDETISIQVKNDFVSPSITENTEIAEFSIFFPLVLGFSTEPLNNNESLHPLTSDSSPPGSPDHTKLSFLQTYLC
ncbi:MAG: hypothetical protein JXJ22_01160 [Bacteroidales bacterium]|nr:hypothetical protein [Bacteroidales bacterium]